MTELQKTTTKGFDKEEGPFVKGLDRALASFNVQRQAYYSGTFIGNHVNRTLKVRYGTKGINIHKPMYTLYRHSFQPKNIDILCHSVVTTAQQLCPSLTGEAETISRVFTQVLSLFGVCHNTYNTRKHLSDTEIDTLSK